MNGDPAFAAFVRAAAREFQRHDSAPARLLSSAISAGAEDAFQGAPPDAPACRFLPEALDAVSAGGYRPPAEFIRVIHALPWRRVGITDMPEPLRSQLAVVEVMGPTGMIQCEACRFGLYLQMPEIFYPNHSHEAEEIYLVLGGGAEWSVESGAFTPKTAGDFIHHRPWQAHAMWSRAAPLLAMWGWTGNISTDTYAIEM
jgi:dimethylpropiothetin dethiomethylase